MVAKELMNRNIIVGTPSMTIKEAAKLMAENWNEPLPIVENNQLIGVLTARAIVTDIVAKDRVGAVIRVRELMTPAIVYCAEDQPVEAAAKLMEEQQFRRLFVVDHDKHLVGVLTLADVARSAMVDQFHQSEKKQIFPDILTGTDAS